MLFSENETGIVSPDDTAITITRKLGLASNRGYRQWGLRGEVYLDFSSVTEAKISQAISRSRKSTLTILNKTLLYESRALSQDSFDTFEAYLKYLVENGFITEQQVNERSKAALKCGLMSHWNRAKASVHTIDDFFETDPLSRKTKWSTLSYTEELEEGGDNELKYGILPEDLDAQRAYFVTPYFTHTTSIDGALGISEKRSIQSTNRNNFANSTLVSIAARGSRRREITFFFDGNDLFQAVPFVHGQSTVEGEHEVTCHFPVDLGLVRAVVPTYIFDLHQTPKLNSQGTISQGVDPSLLIRDR